MVVDHVVNFVLNCWTFVPQFREVIWFGLKVNCMKVKELALIKFWQLPVDANVLQSQIIPLVRIWVVRYAIIVYVFAFSKSPIDFNQLLRVLFCRTASSISILGRDPASINNNCCSFEADWILFVKRRS